MGTLATCFVFPAGKLHLSQIHARLLLQIGGADCLAIDDSVSASVDRASADEIDRVVGDCRSPSFTWKQPQPSDGATSFVVIDGRSFQLNAGTCCGDEAVQT